MRNTIAPALSAARRQVDELYSLRAEVRRPLTLVVRIAVMTAQPDPALRAWLTIHLFSKQDSSGRYGFFPRSQSAPRLL